MFSNELIVSVIFVKDHFEMNVFCLPPDISFIDDGKLDAAMKNYSKEEDMALDDAIQKYLETIHQVPILCRY